MFSIHKQCAVGGLSLLPDSSLSPLFALAHRANQATATDESAAVALQIQKCPRRLMQRPNLLHRPPGIMAL